MSATLWELSDCLDKRGFTSRDLVKTYIARIHEVYHLFNAVIEINPDALSIAERLDEEQPAREGEGNYARSRSH